VRAPAPLLSQRDRARPHLSRRGRFQRDPVDPLDTLSGVAGRGGAVRRLIRPVHVAHLIVAETAADALGCNVHFLPRGEQPFKRAAHQATPEQRAEMLDLAVGDNSRLRVERVELGLATPSYTVRTLRALADREPGTGSRYC